MRQILVGFALRKNLASKASSKSCRVPLLPLLLLVACSKPDPAVPALAAAPAPAPASAPDAALAPPQPPISWQTDEPTARAAAARAGKPVLIDFTARWCAPCHEYDQQLFADPAVRDELAARFVSIRIDVTNGTGADEAVMQRYGVSTLPHVLVLRSDGSEARRYDRPIPAVKDFVNVLLGVK